MTRPEIPTYYECGICGAMHSALWNGDCRQDSARFFVDTLDEKHGSDGWLEIDMDDVDDYQLSRLDRLEGPSAMDPARFLPPAT